MSYEDCRPTHKGTSFIYGLTVGSVIRYVGRSENPMRRFRSHVNAKKGPYAPLLGIDKATVGIVILEAVDKRDACYREEFWIRELLKKAPLVNVQYTGAHGLCAECGRKRARGVA